MIFKIISDVNDPMIFYVKTNENPKLFWKNILDVTVYLK